MLKRLPGNYHIVCYNSNKVYSKLIGEKCMNILLLFVRIAQCRTEVIDGGRKMRFSNILALLKNEYGLEIIESGIAMDEDICEIRLFEEGRGENKGCLYIGTTDESPAWMREYKSELFSVIIGIKDRKDKGGNLDFLSGEAFRDRDVISYALIREDQVLRLVQSLNRILHKELQTSNEAAELMALTMRGADLKTIVGTSAKKLNNPIIIIDAGFKILEVSSLFSIDDPIWMKNIERGYCSYEFIKEVHRLEKIESFPDNADVFEVICKFSQYRKLCSKIFWKEQLVGYVIMLEKNEEAGNLFEEFLPFVGSSVCEVLLHTEEYKGLFGSQKENLLYELIHGAEEELIHIRVKMNHLEFPDRMGCLVVRPNEYLNNMQATAFLKEQIEYILPGAFYIKEKENLVFICKLQQDGQLKSEEEKRLLLLFQQGVVHIGVSSPCTDIMELKDAYEQSCQLYKISTRLRIEKEIMYFSTYNFYVMLSNMSEKDLMQYSHPALKTLRMHDQTHNGELYKTLQAFIECQSHMVKTALALNIHRNSLSYRMSKILDLTGIDLTDCEEIFRISYGFKVEHYCRIAV